MAPPGSSPPRQRLRNTVIVTVAALASVAVGYALSYEPDEETAYRRAAEAQATRVRKAAEEARATGRRRADSISRARQVASLQSSAPPSQQASHTPNSWPCGKLAVPALSYCRSFTIDAQPYRVEFQPNEHKVVEHVRVHDDSGRVVYEENVAATMPPGTQGSWKFSVNVIEDDSGRGRGLWFTYTVPRSPQDSVSYRVIAPRAGKLQALTRPFNFGQVTLSSLGSQDGSVRLFSGNRFFVEQWRSDFETSTPYRVAFECQPGSPACVAPADSINGLVKFWVDPVSQIADAHWRPTDTTVTIELFASPGAKRSQPVKIEPGTQIEILGGAGRTLVGQVGDSIYYALMRDDWLHLRVKEQTGWIRGDKGYGAIAEVDRYGRTSEAHQRP